MKLDRQKLKPVLRHLKMLCFNNFAFGPGFGGVFSEMGCIE